MNVQYNCFAPNDDYERWDSGDDMTAPIEAALESHMSELCIPWIEYSYRRDWEPSDGMTVSIGAGNSVAVTWPEIAPDLQDYLHQQIWDQVGEAADCQSYPDDLQKQFLAWLEKTCGKVRVFRVEDITTVEVRYDGSDWAIVEDSSQ